MLAEPPAVALARAQQAQPLTGLFFALLLVASAALGPIGTRLARTSLSAYRRAASILAIAAAVTQAIGLSRWVVLLPLWDPSAAADVERFDLANRVLGVGIGETLGYLATAGWTLCVVAGARPGLLTRAGRLLGVAAAVAILAGVLVPLGVPGADLTNFVGYLAWSGWMLWLALRLGRAAGRERHGR